MRYELMGVALAVALTLAGCATPDAISNDAADAVGKVVAGGRASSDTTATDTHIQPALAASYMGQATSNADLTSIEGADFQRTLTKGSDTQVGFTFAGVMTSLQDAMSKASATSPTLKALQERLARQTSAETPDEDAIDATIAAIRAEETAMRQALSRAGGDLSSLTHLTQVFTMNSTTGRDGQVSDAIGTAMAEAVPATVEAAKNKDK